MSKMNADNELRESVRNESLDSLLREAVRLRDQGHGPIISYSRKVFVPLTRLCRNVCHYCTFATVPNEVVRPFLTTDEVLEIVKAGERAGCQEALFPLGDRPEERYAAAREQLRSFGCANTI